MKRTQHNNAFTIVELLTVMAVIALLIGLLVPALALVKDRAKDIQQRAQFHAISSGLEMFKADFGDYPDSKDNSYPTPTVHPEDPTPYSGANKLAEAMVGLDYLGFHPNSDFRADGANLVVDKVNPLPQTYNVYHAFDDSQIDWQSAQENIQARRGPYVELENASAFRINEVFSLAVDIAPFTTGWDGAYPLVLCDVYSKKRSGTGGKKTGTPILYYRARTHLTIQDSVTSMDTSIYDIRDNRNILDLGMPDTGAAHSLYTGDPLLNFDDMIRNKNVTTIQRPYRAGSFILWSAGKDGSFGTADDIFNFTREAE